MEEFEPKILGFLCNWCCYAAADTAGVSRFQYPPNLRIIRVMCSGRVDPIFILEGFLNGATGVFIGGCHLGDCQYTYGNYEAVLVVKLVSLLLEQIGIRPERLLLSWHSATEGAQFAQTIDKFISLLKELGPLGKAEGIGQKELLERLQKAKETLDTTKVRIAFGKICQKVRQNNTYSDEEHIVQELKQKVLKHFA